MPPVLLCTDFDDTITQRDTTSLLFQLASCSKSTEQQLVAQYVTELEELLKSYDSSWGQQGRVSKFDRAGLRDFLEGYAAVDLRSTQRVVECRALQGIRRSDIVAAASTVQLRSELCRDAGGCGAVGGAFRQLEHGAGGLCTTTSRDCDLLVTDHREW